VKPSPNADYVRYYVTAQSDMWAIRDKTEQVPLRDYKGDDTGTTAGRIVEVFTQAAHGGWNGANEAAKARCAEMNAQIDRPET
jgi:hypothetical protein